jgi:hypothetical protein
MVLEVTLGNCNVMPSKDGIHDFSSASCKWIVKSWIPAFAGMTGLVGQSLCGLVQDGIVDLLRPRLKKVFLLLFLQKKKCFLSRGQ